MALSNPLTYLVNGLTTLVDAIRVNVGSSSVSREVIVLADDQDSTTLPIVARINPVTHGLAVDVLQNGALAALPVTIAANMSQTGTLSSAAASISNVLLLAANSNRKAISIFNESSATMYLAASGTASMTAYSEQVPAGELWESSIDYQGPLSAVWGTANPTGFARITEYV